MHARLVEEEVATSSAFSVELVLASVRASTGLELWVNEKVALVKWLKVDTFPWSYFYSKIYLILVL